MEKSVNGAGLPGVAPAQAGPPSRCVCRVMKNTLRPTLACVGEVQLWGVLVRAVPLRAPSRAGVELLATHERARADRFVSPADGADFLAGRIALRMFAAELAGVHPADLEADYRCGTCGAGNADHGRPGYRRRDGEPGPLLSLSRAGGWALLAGAASGTGLSGLGVDAEESRGTGFPGFDALALSSRERLHTAPRTTAEGLYQRARIWARKEAFLKAKGSGLQRDPASVDVTGDRLEGVRLGDLDAARLGLPTGMVAALAASGMETLPGSGASPAVPHAGGRAES